MGRPVDFAVEDAWNGKGFWREACPIVLCKEKKKKKEDGGRPEATLGRVKSSFLLHLSPR